MRLTEKQKALMAELTQALGDNEMVEMKCLPWEYGTAKALENRGLVEIAEGKGALGHFGVTIRMKRKGE